MGTPRIAAIVLQYGQWQKTRESVLSLLRSTMAPWRVVVVDNASPDDSASQIHSFLASQGPVAHIQRSGERAKEKLVLLQMASNGGYASGNNAGIDAAPGADGYLILNNDATVAPNALEIMWRRLQKSLRPGLCGPTIAYPAAPGAQQTIQCCAGGHTNYSTGLSTFTGEGLTVHEAMALNQQDVEQNLNFICGACVLASGEFVREVGPMDEGFFLYCEEQDWALRAGKHFSLAWAPEALCIHQEGASTGWSRQSFHWLSGLRLMRSRLRLALRHHPWHLPTVALGCIFAAGRLLGKKLTDGHSPLAR